MKEKRMRELMRSADDSQLRYIAGCKASEDAEKERIFRRVRNAQRIAKAPPITESAPIPMEKHTGHFDWLHGTGSVIAACLVVVVTVGMIVAVKQAKPPISPGTPVTEQAVCKVPVYTPFGNILDAELLFRYPTETTRNAQQQMRESGNPDAVLMEERTLTKEQQQALAEVFRVYGWREQANNSAPESTVTDDCIEMHLYRTPERNSDDVTAYFQFDGEGQHLVRVDEKGETKWYDLDEDIIRCLRSIIMNQQITEYQPPERRFADVMSRITYVSDDTGERLLGSMTPGQEAAISTLLNNATLYEWNTLREGDPMHGRYIRLELMEPLEPDETPAQQTYGRMTFWLDTGCLTYEITDTFHGSEEDVIVSGSDHRYQYYWVDEDAFMEKAEKLFRESIYPGCPVGDLMEVELSADPEPKGVNATTWKGQLSAYLNTLEWKEIICPVAEEVKYNYKQLEMVYVRNDKKYSLTFYPEQNFMEWTEEHEKYTLVHTDNTETHVVSHYFSMPPEVWADVQSILQESGTPSALKGEKTGAPFGDLYGSQFYFWTENNAMQYFSIGSPTMGSEEQNALIEYLSRLSYEEADFQEGMMAGGKYLDIFINKAGDVRMLECWMSGDVIEYRCDADGTVHKHWIKVKDDVYTNVLAFLGRPLEYYPMDYTTQANIKNHLPEVVAAMFPKNPQPFMNLLLSSWMPECTVTNSWETGKRFGVTLPEDGQKFTFDCFQMQELFEDFAWQEVNVPVQKWTAGYAEIQLNQKETLRIGTAPNDTFGHYLIRYQNGTEEANYFYADESFISHFVQILSGTSTICERDDAAKESEQIVQNAKAFLQNNCADILDTIDWSLTDSGKIVKLPDSYQEVAQLEWKPGSERIGSFWQVTFHTSQDALLGPVIVYLTEDGTVIGLGYRE